jgi:hypothetical protein
LCLICTQKWEIFLGSDLVSQYGMYIYYYLIKEPR